MIEIAARALYTVLLLSLAGFCLREAWLTWNDNTIEYGTFAATKDGQNTDAAGNTFRRLIVQQQRRLFQLYQPDSKLSKAGEFRAPGEAIHIRSLSDLGDVPRSLLDDLKIEAAGVNVTSVVSTLRRWVRQPNEITGSVDQVGNTFYVTASWPRAPERSGWGTEARTFVLPPYSDIEAASFDAGCRIFLARIAAADSIWREVAENDFCAFSRALAAFKDYVRQRDRALTDDEKKTAREKYLVPAQLEIDRLLQGGTTLLFALKLGGYIDIERFGAIPPDDTKQTKIVLDQAEARFNEYLKRVSDTRPDFKDADVQERIAYLAARRGQAVGSQQVQARTKDFLGAVERTRTSAAAAVVSGPPGPGASIGPVGVASAGTLCCFVRDAAGKRYLLTASSNVGKVGSAVISPASIDQVNANAAEIGTVARIVGVVALVEIGAGVAASNGSIAGLADAVAVGDTLSLVGRTSKSASGKVTTVEVSLPVWTGDGEMLLDHAIMTERMSLPGDGGAPVLDAKNRLVGLLFAGSGTASVISPLKPVFDQERLTLL